MARTTMSEVEEFPTLPDDSILLMKVENNEVRTVQGQRGEWEKLNIEFKILDIQVTGDGSPKEDYESLLGEKIFGSCSFRLTTSPENKLRQWTEAILAMELAPGFELDTDLLNRRQVRGVTSSYVNKNGRRRHQVESLLPVGEVIRLTAPEPQIVIGAGNGLVDQVANVQAQVAQVLVAKAAAQASVDPWDAPF